MRKLVLAGLSVGLALSAAHASGGTGNAMLDAGAMGQAGVAPAMRAAGPAVGHGVWGRRVNGRWAAGWNAPGGWNGYYRPVAGWTLPGYWIDPAFYIADVQAYGLPVPTASFGWSRYYDDAVLTDRYGRVVDVRYGYDWDRFGGYDDDYGPDYGRPVYAEQRGGHGNAIAGAVVGGLVGGVAGHALAGHGDKAFGTVLGAGVGAVAGAAIGGSADRHKRYKHYREPGYEGAPYPDGYAYGAPPATYDGQWQGTWYGRDGRAYSGTYDGRFQGDVRGGYQAYAPPVTLPYAPGPAYGYAANGFATASYYSAEYVAPTVVTTTVTTEETTYASRSARALCTTRRARARTVCCPCGC